ncbi:MAG TPA: hypothetical protein VM434_05490 [Beijerinckiaceae bacterium]|nr:hypothetical protein [Beijerinckiaceae bacterium]
MKAKKKHNEEFTMRRALTVFGVSAVLAAAASFVILPNGVSRAAATGPLPKSEATFLVPANDGYGVGDCLTGGNAECGRIVAAAWCETHGYRRVVSFGRAEPESVTGSVVPAALSAAAARPVSITCAD